MKPERMEKEVRALVAEMAKRDPAEVSLYDDFSEDLGLDSLDRLELLAAIEDLCDLRIDDQDVSDVTNLGGLLDVLAVQMRATAA